MSKLGTDIQGRRKDLGLPIDEVARLAGLASARLAAIESGEGPTTWELSVVAGALACDPAQLMLGGAEDPTRSVARFRTGNAAGNLTGRDLRLLARGAEAGRILARLKEKLGDQVSRVTSIRHICAPSSGHEAWEEGYELGSEARSLLAPAGPILSVQSVFEEAGVHVAQVDFDSDSVEAASLYELGAAPVILLNRTASKVAFSLARRAILAHELCHLIHDGGQRDITVVTRDTDNSEIEKRANGFAPSFIAPKSLVAELIRKAKRKNPRELVGELGRSWGLSFEGAAWHAKNLKLIDPKVAEQLVAGKKQDVKSNFEQTIQRTPPEQFGIEVQPTNLANGLLSETAIMACAEGAISRGVPQRSFRSNDDVVR